MVTGCEGNWIKKPGDGRKMSELCVFFLQLQDVVTEGKIVFEATVSQHLC